MQAPPTKNIVGRAYWYMPVKIYLAKSHPIPVRCSKTTEKLVLLMMHLKGRGNEILSANKGTGTPITVFTAEIDSKKFFLRIRLNNFSKEFWDLD